MARQGGRLRVRLIGRRGEGMAARARGPGLRCGRREEMYRYTLDAYRERRCARYNIVPTGWWM
jgi:hypothetical protein